MAGIAFWGVALQKTSLTQTANHGNVTKSRLEHIVVASTSLSQLVGQNSYLLCDNRLQTEQSTLSLSPSLSLKTNYIYIVKRSPVYPYCTANQASFTSTTNLVPILSTWSDLTIINTLPLSGYAASSRQIERNQGRNERETRV